MVLEGLKKKLLERRIAKMPEGQERNAAIQQARALDSAMIAREEQQKIKAAKVQEKRLVALERQTALESQRASLFKQKSAVEQSKATIRKARNVERDNFFGLSSPSRGISKKPTAQSLFGSSNSFGGSGSFSKPKLTASKKKSRGRRARVKSISNTDSFGIGGGSSGFFN